MKKLIVVGAILFFVLLSCATNYIPLVTDESVPEDEMAVIYFNRDDYRFYPSAINGAKLASRSYALKIPAGASTITGDMKFLVESGQTNDTAEKAFERNDVRFLFDFEAGKSYYVTSDCFGESAHRLIANVPFEGTTIVLGPPVYGGVDIYLVEEFTERGQPRLKSAQFIKSVYFKNNIVFGKETKKSDTKEKVADIDNLEVDEKRALYEKLKREFEGNAEK
jgi:hypothetical protein